jgi:hypothetical protein
MTTPPVDEPEPPRGGTPLDDALARDPDREDGAGFDADDDTDRGDDPTTETEEDPRYA